MRSPKILKLMLILPAYPILYYAWVQQIKNTWIQNDIKDLHPEILFPQHDRYTLKNSPNDLDQQFEECLKFQSKGLKAEYAKRIRTKQQQAK